MTEQDLKICEMVKEEQDYILKNGHIDKAYNRREIIQIINGDSERKNKYILYTDIMVGICLSFVASYIATLIYLHSIK